MNSNTQTQDIALAGVLLLIIIGSAFDLTSKFSLTLAILLFAIVWISAYQNGTLSAAAKGIIS